MTINLEIDENVREADGRGGKLKQKTDFVMRNRSPKSMSSSNMYLSKYVPEKACRSVNVMPQKTYIFWILIFIIFFVAVVNFSILVIMISVLRIGEGMESMEIISKDGVIKFHGAADFDYVLYGDGVLKGFQDVPLEIQSNEGSMLVSVKSIDDEMKSDRLKVSENEISFSNIEKFYVFDPRSRSNIFSTEHKNFKIPKGLPTLDVKKLHVKRILSKQNSNLTIRSDTITRFRGNEGLSIRGERIALAADGDIYLNSVNGSIYLLANNVKIDMKHIPIAIPNVTFNLNGLRPVKQFKLCVCMPQGYLFKVPILNHIKPHLACSFVDLSHEKNPCAKF